MVDIARYAFRLSAWNELAGVDDHFILIYYVKNDNTSEIEISNPKLKRRFLSRIAYPALKLDDIRPGGRIMIYSKQYKVDDYEDRLTREALGKSQATSFALVTETGIPALGKMWLAAEAMGLKVVNCKYVTLSATDALGVSSAVGSSRGITGGSSVLALSFAGENSAEKVRTLASHAEAKAGASAGSVFAAVDDRASEEMTQAFFSEAKSGSTSGGAGAGAASGGQIKSARDYCFKASDCAVAFVLPSAISGGNAGNIITDIQEKGKELGLTISGVRMAAFSRLQAEEFLEVYKLVVPEYVEMVNEYSRGPFVALEIYGEDAVNQMRAFAGPRDVEVGRRVRKESLRAKYGVSGGQSGVHVTELVDDGPLESEYVFSLLE